MDPPYSDETWGSFLDRTARYYRCDRKAFIAQLTGIWPEMPWRREDYDVYLPDEIHAPLIDALGVSRDTVPNVNRGIYSESLPPKRREEYCPLCFLDDLRAARTPYFRYQWAIPLLTHCQTHGTPLMRWRSRRMHDERILPWRWTVRPHIKLVGECPWLQEDLAFVRQFSPSKLKQSHPFSLVRRLSDSVLQVDNAPRWRLDSHVHRGFRLESLIMLGASARDTPGESLASVLRPQGEDRLFGPARAPVSWEAHYLRRCWISDAMTVAFRRSLLWFAARTIFGSRTPTLLADGRTAPAGNWERWWMESVVPVVGGALSGRAKSEEKHIRMYANHGQGALF